MLLLEREDALATLDAALDEAREGCGVVALVAGEAGIGKTSLLGRFAAGLGDDVHLRVGRCDDLSVPRPLGPFLDIAEGAPALAADLATGDRVAALRAVLAELARHTPTVWVIEDAHWADEATLDVVTYVGRRIEQAGALLVMSARDDELAADHPLRRALAAVPPARLYRVELRPLTVGAVRRLAGPDADARGLHELTGGNPFFVTEAMDCGLDRAPASVRDSVLARASRISTSAREALELVSVVPGRAELWLVAECVGGADAALAEGEARGLVVIGDGTARFRHELARRAVEESLTGARRAALNRDVLAALGAHGAAPARLAHHAAGAGDPEAVLAHGLVAARAAATARSHREAADLFDLALQHDAALAPGERARALEELSEESYHVGRSERALRAREQALAVRRELGDPLATGATLRWLSRLRWWSRDRAGADRAGAEAVAVLEGLPPSRELALALSNRAQLAMLAQRDEETLEWGARAADLARELGDTEALVHAQTNVGTALARSDPDRGFALLEESAALAITAGLDEHACRALTNAAWMAKDLHRYAHAWSTADRALAFALEREQIGFAEYLMNIRAMADLATGRWDEAAESVRRQVERGDGGDPVARIPALQVLALLELRRGEGRPQERLDEAWRLALETEELQRIGPIACARAEHAWVTGDLDGVDEVDEATRQAFALALEVGNGWDIGELAVWRHRAGVLDAVPAGIPSPFGPELAGDPLEAARAWSTFGAPYAQALALMAAGGERPVLDALAILDGLGAHAVAGIARRRLRRLGARGIPRGPRPETRENPAGLSARQLEILDFLADGLSNPEIARRLVLSPKTVEHHVAAVFRKLGVRTRSEAAAAGLRLRGDAGQAGGPGAPTPGSVPDSPPARRA